MWPPTGQTNTSDVSSSPVSSRIFCIAFFYFPSLPLTTIRSPRRVAKQGGVSSYANFNKIHTWHIILATVNNGFFINSQITYVLQLLFTCHTIFYPHLVSRINRMPPSPRMWVGWSLKFPTSITLHSFCTPFWVPSSFSSSSFPFYWGASEEVEVRVLLEILGLLGSPNLDSILQRICIQTDTLF